MKRNVSANPPRGLIFACAGIFWCSFTFWLDGQMAWTVGRQWYAGSYTATTGIVSHADAVRVPRRRHQHRDYWRADIRYSYVVAGQRYESSRLRYDNLEETREEILQHIARYPLRQAVSVYYNHSSPGEAVLEQDLDLESVAAATLGLTPFNAAALGFVGFFLCWPLSRWLGRPVVAVSVRDNGLQTRIRFYENSPALHALMGLGLCGVLSIFVGAALTWVIPLRIALVLAWIGMLSGGLLAWWNARQKYVELRRDHVRGTVEIGREDGAFMLAPATNLESAWPKRRDSENAQPLSLRFMDVNQRQRTVRLPRQATQDETIMIVDWLNRLLGLPSNS